jgi:hypothetical protein
MFGVAARLEYRAFLDEPIDEPTMTVYESLWGQTRGV